MDDPSNRIETAEPDDQNPGKPASATKTAGAPAKRPRYVRKSPVTPHKHHSLLEDDDDEGFFKRNMVPIIVGVAVVGGGAFFVTHMPSGNGSSTSHQSERIVSIQLPPPPPPPPPKLMPTPPPKEDKPDQMKESIDKPMDKPMDKPKSADKPPEGLGTNIKGSGEGLAGLGTSGNGMIGGTGTGPGGGGSAFGWYAGQVQARVADALRKNPHTSTSTLNIEVKVWPDASGRISRAQLVGSTGDRVMDDAIKNDVLTGLQMQEPPPAGMPAPIILRIHARRP